jgi:hypothetical protein
MGSLRSSNLEPPMSALGQKQTSRHLQPMSALPPKADMDQHGRDVRFVPKAGMPALALGSYRLSVRVRFRLASWVSNRQVICDQAPISPQQAAKLFVRSRTSPTPEPISRTRCPRDMPAFLNKRSVNGLKILACRLSRSCSRPVPPSTYDALGEEIAISTTLQSYYVPRICMGCHSPTPRAMSSKRKYITN